MSIYDTIAQGTAPIDYSNTLARIAALRQRDTALAQDQQQIDQRNALMQRAQAEQDQQTADEAAQEQAWLAAIKEGDATGDYSKALQIDPQHTQLYAQAKVALRDLGKPKGLTLGTINPGDFTPESIAAAMSGNDPSKLVHYQAPQRAPIEGPESFGQPIVAADGKMYQIGNRGSIRPVALGGQPIIGQKKSGESTNPAGLNDRQVSGFNMIRDNAIMYAANITGLSRDEISRVLSTQGPDAVGNLMKLRGKRGLQGPSARVLQSFPLGKTIVEANNSDLIAPAKGGGAGIALTQNPTGPVANADFQAGEAQFPGPAYPLATQADMIVNMLKNAQRMESTPSATPSDPLGIR